MWTIRHYVNPQGFDLFQEWVDELLDQRARARIAARLLRIELGNLGDCKSVGDGVRELRIDYGPGYRVYFAMINKQAVLLCCGGTKKSQRSDIQRAKRLWQEWQQRNS